LLEVLLLRNIDSLISLLDVVLSLLDSPTVAELTVDVADHGFSEGDSSALPLAYELPILGAIQ
jgi:hypothetical protein